MPESYVSAYEKSTTFGALRESWPCWIPQGSPAIRPMRVTKNPAKGKSEDGDVTAHHLSARSLRPLPPRNSGHKALNPRGLGTESPTPAAPVIPMPYGADRFTQNRGHSLAGFSVTLIGRIEVTAEGWIGRRKRPHEPNCITTCGRGATGTLGIVVMKTDPRSRAPAFAGSF